MPTSSSTPTTAPWLRLRGRTWIVLILNGIFLALGCNPNSATMLLSPFFDDGGMPPEFKLVADKKKEVTVAIVCNFSRPAETYETLAADTELAEKFCQTIKKRCKENKEKVKLVPNNEVRRFQNKPGQSAVLSSIEIGKHFKADFVIELEINSLSVYEPRSNRTLYRGRGDISVNLYDLHQTEGSFKVHDKIFRMEHPTNGPTDAGNSSVEQYRGKFLQRIADEMVKIYFTYSADDRFNGGLD